ncbi:hypothetical protein [Bosea sp. (in: a-proteobacteria)]|uniref:hypothetical protein n=1 Tax=Bosea sp. (in: a-proteobacteria) TaxID=1871050 RepID=UPI002732746C|nr:hypothetical protein [Bosea sp. (in: a-proteobacteria)]MDP3254847.1 hypothetical protein [Bosea sp. (in: a-proteobacteria)]
MNFHAHDDRIREPIETCLIGSGGFGRSCFRPEDRAAPFYLAADRRLARTARAGEAIGLGDDEIAPDSGLLAMRRRQDGLFAGGG